jgi:hypothetical protein
MCLLILNRLACGHFAGRNDEQFIHCARAHKPEDNPKQVVRFVAKFTSVNMGLNDDSENTEGDEHPKRSVTVAYNEPVLEVIFDIFDIMCHVCEAEDDALPEDQKKLSHVPKVMHPEPNKFGEWVATIRKWQVRDDGTLGY